MFFNLNKLTDTVQKTKGYIQMYTCVACLKWSVMAQSQCSMAIRRDFLWVKSLMWYYFINIHFPVVYILAKARSMSLDFSKVGRSLSASTWKSSSLSLQWLLALFLGFESALLQYQGETIEAESFESLVTGCGRVACIIL